MNGQLAKKLRKLCKLDLKNEECLMEQIGQRKVLVLDPDKGDHVEERPVTRARSSDRKRLYRMMKAAYTRNYELYNHLVELARRN